MQLLHLSSGKFHSAVNAWQLADFGLARQLEAGSKIDTFSCGTITHTAPELMDEGLLTKAAVREPTHAARSEATGKHRLSSHMRHCSRHPVPSFSNASWQLASMVAILLGV